MFIVFSIPASYIIDRFGYRCSLIIGASLTAIFSIVRAMFPANFTIVLISQFMIAIGQPFLLNISTKVPANWFPQNERSTAAGILVMAQYIGFIIPMALVPTLVKGIGIEGIYSLFCIIAVISATLAISLTKEKPRIPIGNEPNTETAFNLKCFKQLAVNQSYQSVFIISFISIGVFNTLLSLIESILMPRGISSTHAGITGAIFVVAGIIGAIVIPIISDKLNKKIPIIIGALVLLAPLYIAFSLIDSFILISVVAGFTGFTVMGVAPILFQYGSEVAYPVKEGTSLGILLLAGQVSGVLFVSVFEILLEMTKSILLPMFIIILITLLQLPLTLRLKETTNDDVTLSHITK